MKSGNIGLYVQGILTGLILFLLANPYYMWEHQTLGYVLRLLYGLILLLNYRKEKISSQVIWAILLAYISLASGSSIIAFFVFVFANIFLLSAKTGYLYIAYNALYNIFVVVALLSIINYALFFLGVSMPSRIIEPLNDVKDYNYTAYPFLVITNAIKDFMRFEGVFDEPGALATSCFLFLWAEKFELFKWKNIVLMVAGFLTLSLFFIIAIGVVMFIKVFSKGTKFWFRVLCVGLFALFAYSLTIEDSVLFTAIGERLEFDEEKGIKGNNRSNKTLDYYYDQVSWKEPLFYWGPTLSGIEKDKVLEMTEGAAGYKSAILVNGLVGCVFYILFFLIYARKRIKKRRDYLLFALCFLMTIYQRPFFYDIVFIFLFVSIIKLHDYQPAEVTEDNKKAIISGKNIIKESNLLLQKNQV